MAGLISAFAFPSLSGKVLAVIGGCVAALVLIAFASRKIGLRMWERYAEKRSELFQPAILMAIANPASKQLGPPFSDSRRIGDWTIMEEALLTWSKGLRGFALQGFCRIFDENGFGEATRTGLKSFRAAVRAKAARRLGRMLYYKAVPDLIEALEDSSPEVGRMASWALANMGQSDAPGRIVTAPPPKEQEEAAEFREGSASGRLYWEDGEHIEIADKQETAYLMRKPGGLAASVRNLPPPGAGRRAGGAWKTYNSEYILHWLNPRFPAVIAAVLRQSVEDYYVVTLRIRKNIPLRAGCVTENIDFIFPRYTGSEDRISVVGTLVYPELPDGAPKRGKPGVHVALQAAAGQFRIEFICFHDAGTYRLHDVPAGKYKLKVVAGGFGYEGALEVTDTQPMSHNIALR